MKQIKRDLNLELPKGKGGPILFFQRANNTPFNTIRISNTILYGIQILEFYKRSMPKPTMPNKSQIIFLIVFKI